MSHIIAAAIAAMTFTFKPTMTGYVAHYGEGVFEEVINVRIENEYGYVPADWQSYDGYLAVIDCAAVGNEVWARPGPGYQWERFLIADCSGDASTTYWFQINRVVAEVDYATYYRWKAAGYHTELGLPIEIVPLEDFYQLF
jgi:hypothetical protein